jgi:hypothetical protein
MSVTIRNLAWLRNVKVEGHPEFGVKLAEALSDIAQAAGNIEQQTNSNASGRDPVPPAPIGSLMVTGQNGHFNIQIRDDSNVYRGVRYYVEHDSSPSFSNPQVIRLGDSRNHNVFLGNVTRYWRAFSSYGASGISRPVVFGGTQPTPVQGGGTVGGPAFQASQSSGTGQPGQGPSGPGPVAFRSATGKPPARGS